MSTLTPNYSFILPGVNDAADQDLWGGYLNANWSALDTTLAALNVNVPVGSGMDYFGSSAPSGWAFLYGQALNRTTYADLFAAIGTTYGIGDGSTTFNVPDLRGRTAFGKDDMGGVSADRLTGLTNGIDGDVLGDTGGEEAHTLTDAESPDVTLSLKEAVEIGTDDDFNYVSAGWTGGPVLGDYTEPVASNTGSTTAHNTLPPGIVCNKIMFTGVV